jgi:hypothetical protein
MKSNYYFPIKYAEKNSVAKSTVAQSIRRQKEEEYYPLLATLPTSL